MTIPALIALASDYSSRHCSMQMEGVYALTSFFGSRAQPERDVRFSYCAMAIAYMLDDWSMLNVDQAVAFLQRCRVRLILTDL